MSKLKVAFDDLSDLYYIKIDDQGDCLKNSDGEIMYFDCFGDAMLAILNTHCL